MQSDQENRSTVDWTTIEGSDEFRELTRSRQRFTSLAGGIGLGFGLLYVILMGFAGGLMDTEIGFIGSLGFLGGVLLILLTWLITFAYMRQSEKVWAPLEDQVREIAQRGGKTASYDR